MSRSISFPMHCRNDLEENNVNVKEPQSQAVSQRRFTLVVVVGVVVVVVYICVKDIRM